MFRCSVIMAGVKRLKQHPSTPLLAALLLLVGLLGEVDGIGPPPGAAGTIDWRYPDSVMSFPLPCNTNGTFRHPIFCNWYYRCYETTYFPGFYQRATFMCAPGTEFAETLEQCVWRGSSDTADIDFPCSYLDDAWPQGVAATAGVEPGTAGGASNVDTEDCQVLVSRCRNDFLCLPEFIPRVSYAVPVQVCDLAERTCPSGLSPACAGGEIWDETNKVCLPTDFLCSESPQPTATSGGPDIECQFEIPGECRDYLTCLSSDLSTPLPIRSCPTAARTCALASLSDRRQKAVDICPSKNYDLFLEDCDDRFRWEDVSFDCNAGIIPSFNNLADCKVVKTACDEYISCETRERFTGCSNYYHCHSSLFPQQFPCPLGHVYYPSAASNSPCLAVRPPAVPRLQGNATCVSTGNQPLLQDPAGQPPTLRQHGLGSSGNTRYTGNGYTRDERSANNPKTEIEIEGRAIGALKITPESPKDSLLPNNYHDTVERSSSNERKFTPPSVPESLVNLAHSLRNDEMDSKQVEVLPIPADDSECTLIQIPPEYFQSSTQTETIADKYISVDVSDDDHFETNSTVESDYVVEIDDPICKFVGERPLPQNFSDILQCSEKDICNRHGQLLDSKLGCSTFVQCLPDAQGRLEVEYLSCSPGHFFVAEELRCRDHAHYGGVPCSSEPSPPAATICSAKYEVLELPSHEFEQHCSSFSACNGTVGEDQVGVTLCSAFYQCLLEPASSALQPVMMSCHQPLLFSYQHLQCLLPTSPLICS